MKLNCKLFSVLFSLIFILSCAKQKEIYCFNKNFETITVGDPAFRDTVKYALLNPNESKYNRMLFDACSARSVALNSFFSETLKLCESSEINAEAEVGMSYTLKFLLEYFGDDYFASELQKTSSRKCAAVKVILDKIDKNQYPKVADIIDNIKVPEFPLLRAYNSN